MGNFSLADLGLRRGCQELLLVSCCVQGRGAHPNNHQQLSLARWVSGHKHTRNPPPDDFSDSACHEQEPGLLLQGTALPRLGQVSRDRLCPQHLLPHLQADVGPRLGCVTPLSPPLAQGLCNYLASRARWRTVCKW